MLVPIGSTVLKYVRVGRLRCEQGAGVVHLLRDSLVEEDEEEVGGGGGGGGGGGVRATV